MRARSSDSLSCPLRIHAPLYPDIEISHPPYRQPPTIHFEHQKVQQAIVFYELKSKKTSLAKRDNGVFISHRWRFTIQPRILLRLQELAKQRYLDIPTLPRPLLTPQPGTGGTPPTLSGYLKIQRWGLYLLSQRQNLHDPTPIPTTGPSYLSPQKLHHRPGGRPKLTRWTLPQRQHPDTITPQAKRALHDLMASFASQPPYASFITAGPSKTEGGTGDAIYIKPDVEGMNPNAKKIFYEIAHVHPSEQSLHVYLSPADARMVVERGWGERFPVTWLAPPSWVMVYAPRDEDEVGVVREIVRAGVCFAAGRKLED